jgi:hypothetical protein
MARQPKGRLAPASSRGTALEAIVGRAILDPAFRKMLFKSPEKVRAEYDLTPQELAALKRIKPAHLETFADTLQAKLLKSASVTIFCAVQRRE